MKSRGWLLVAGLGLLVVLFLAALPTRAYFDQRDQRRVVAAQIGSLSTQNQELDERVRQLQTPAEVERLAREQYGLVRPGEEVYSVPGLPAPAPPPPAPAPPPEPDKAWWEKALDVVTSVF